MDQSKADDLTHHTRFKYCQNRLKYRDGKKSTAVKVYTIANESKHLLVFGVPKINLMAEVKREFSKIGAISIITIVTNEIARKVELEMFTDCYHIVFQKLHVARKAKKNLDARSFYGGILHISYAPEYESTNDVKDKLQQRISEVNYRIRINSNKNAHQKTDRKRKMSTEHIDINNVVVKEDDQHLANKKRKT